MSKGNTIDGGKFGEIMVNVCGWHLMRLVGKLLYNRRLCVRSLEIEGRCREISI
jgi:hypothetical protein